MAGVLGGCWEELAAARDDEKAAGYLFDDIQEIKSGTFLLSLTGFCLLDFVALADPDPDLDL